MSNKHNGFFVKISIFILAATLSIEEIISLVLQGVSSQWPELSDVSVQFIYSLMVLVEMLSAFIMGRVARRYTKKSIIVVANIAAATTGILTFILPDNIYLLYAASIFIGIFCSALSTVSKSMVPEFFKEEDRAKVYGLQVIATALVTSLIFIAGGKLLEAGWKNVYLLFSLLYIPALCTFFMLPKGKTEPINETKQHTFEPKIIGLCVITFLFAIAYMTYSTNITFFIKEKGLGDAVSGYLSSVIKLSSFLVGITLSPILKSMKKYSLIFALSLAGAGYFILSMSNSIYSLILSAILIGFGCGAFSPVIYMQVPACVKECNITSSIAYINSSSCLGMFLNPYVITLASKYLKTGISGRFVMAGILCFIIIGFYFVLLIKKRLPVK